MKNEPCVRFGIRIRPKISEKPADRRNSKPPSVTLLMARSSQRLTGAPPADRVLPPASALEGRVVARVHGLREEPLLVVGPELAHVRVRLDGGVDQLVALLLAAPNVEAPHHVAEMIEGERPARGVGERDAPERLAEGLTVLALPARLLERGLRDHAVDVDAGGVEA